MSAWTVIAHYEVPSGGVASYEFTNIPQDGIDLAVLVSTRSTRSNSVLDTIEIKPNGSGGTQRRLYGGGSDGVGSASDSVIHGVTSTAQSTASTFGNALFYIPNYTATVAKSVSVDSVSESNATDVYMWITAGLTTTTSAITSITFACGNGNLVQYSSLTLYKITKGSSGGVTVS